MARLFRGLRQVWHLMKEMKSQEARVKRETEELAAALTKMKDLHKKELSDEERLAPLRTTVEQMESMLQLAHDEADRMSEKILGVKSADMLNDV
mmetsp:Transcript_25713/g.60717  ORF Transcript_25713/g.60717 Transcript_25713/m.60717 type:complete len:94 (+) Transcript_25713:3-284(+)